MKNLNSIPPMRPLGHLTAGKGTGGTPFFWTPKICLKHPFTIITPPDHDHCNHIPDNWLRWANLSSCLLKADPTEHENELYSPMRRTCQILTVTAGLEKAIDWTSTPPSTEMVSTLENESRCRYSMKRAPFTIIWDKTGFRRDKKWYIIYAI